MQINQNINKCSEMLMITCFFYCVSIDYLELELEDILQMLFNLSSRYGDITIYICSMRPLEVYIMCYHGIYIPEAGQLSYHWHLQGDLHVIYQYTYSAAYYTNIIAVQTFLIGTSKGSYQHLIIESLGYYPEVTTSLASKLLSSTYCNWLWQL